MDLNDPALFRAYYRRLYDLTRPEAMNKDLWEAVKGLDFPDVARLYRLISPGSINVLVPYLAEMEMYEALVRELEQTGLRGEWMRRAQPLTVGLYRPKEDDPVWSHLLPAPLTGRESSDEWFVYNEPEHYHDRLGLLPPTVPPVWMV
jgi:hypothetical protein